ncbi:MAG: GntR family transcriptional regulator [Firmicutes bacterium]|nr:GntR family transcriptional regulator [Bacillota bacterium]
MQNIVRKDIPVPAYYQIGEYLRELIETDELKPGDKLPSEQELSETFGVSRMTVRKAMDTLVQEGMLSREQGRGTFVQRRRFKENLMTVTSFDDDMRRQDAVASAKLLGIQTVKADDRLARRLQVGVGTAIFRISRVRYADEMPIGLQTYYIPSKYAPGLDKDDLTQSIQGLLTNQYGHRLVRTQLWLESVPADEFQATYLGVPLQFPLLKKRVLLFNDKGLPVEYLRVLYRSDRYEFFLETVSQS